MITLTVDLEDPTGEYAPDGRYVAMTQRILDMFAEAERRATFFVIGRVAESAPLLIKEIANRGHEIAYHSHNHISLTEEVPERFRSESGADKEKLEQISGKPVIGFRAPRFSLTPESKWTLDILKELGFVYSSSVMPTKISRYGYPGAPRTPFKWPNGLIELPLPVTNFLRLPYLGGIYLYLLPIHMTAHMANHADKKEILWTYTHPYDFDVDEDFKPMPGESYWVSLILWLSRRMAKKKIEYIANGTNAPTLGERALQF